VSTRAKSPAFQFYPQDWLSDINVVAMSAEEESAYIRLICYCWLQGSIPNNDEYLAKLIKGGSTTVVGVVKRCFHPHPNDETLLVHPRLEREREKQREWSRKSAAGGQESQKVQRDRRKVKAGSTTPPRVVPECLQPNGNTSSSSSSSSSEDKNKNPLSDSQSSSDSDGTPSSPEEFIYSEYPRKEGRRAAIKQIELAVVRMRRGERPLEPLSKGDAQKLLFKRVRAYAQSPAGQNPDKSKIPHPKTWFGQSRYLDDSANWQIVTDNGGSIAIQRSNRSKTDGNIDAARRAIVALTGIDPYEPGASAPSAYQLGNAQTICPEIIPSGSAGCERSGWQDGFTATP
jgi:hypothetical protein